ncbi:hypothetical protein CDAR_307151 [Caerostris darwini]|uniref:Uncharacterized protein n=1 Tax=Caerostris darwini TaxID=1538125 RepID=A0AAV4NYZ3_9ARAC|nr:hypothetical protein CDAR_307151 [Caerostris darwini]
MLPAAGPLLKITSLDLFIRPRFHVLLLSVRLANIFRSVLEMVLGGGGSSGDEGTTANDLVSNGPLTKPKCRFLQMVRSYLFLKRAYGFSPGALMWI